MSVQGRKTRRTSALRGITRAAATILLLFLAGAGLFAQAASAQTYAISSCGDCHGDPPVDGARNATTGAVLGSHIKHASSGEYAYDCTVCHVNVTRLPTPAYNHRDGNINMISPLNAHSGSYDKGNTFPQTNTPTLSTCSTTYCHSAGTGGTTQTGDARPVAANTSPTWGTAGPLACNACHGKETGNDGTGRPWYISGTPKANTHVTSVKHASLSCDKCHNQTSTTGTTITSKTLHADRQYQIVGTGTQPYTFTYAYDSTGGTCATAYCHSNVQTVPPGGALTYQTPKWGDAASGACGTCHGKDTDPGKMATASHTKHVQTSTYNQACATCHAGGSGTEQHADGSVDVAISASFGGSYSGTPAPGDAYGSCSSVTCHNDGTGVYTAVQAYGNPVWGSAGGCNLCHGNTIYTNYRNATPLYASGSPKPNAHAYHTSVTDTSASGDGTGTECRNCHSSVTATNTAIDGATPADHVTGSYNVAAGFTYRDGDNVGGAAVTVTTDYTFKAGGTGPSTCNTVSCHPTGLAGSKAASTTKWSDTYACTDCHNINMNNTTGYHHVMDAAAMTDRTYPTTAPTGSATDANRKCTMCHVDHSIFSPLLNASSTGRSMNLRAAIGTTPTATSGYTNSDYATGGGICISCHATGLAKNTTARKDDGTTTTLVVTDAQYSASAHKYAVASTMANGSTTFNADCSKCHNAKNAETTSFQTAARQFGTHDASSKRLLAALGGTLTENYEEAFCYRCHSKAADAIGGTKKSVDANDWYGVVTNMTAKSTAIYQAFQKTNRHPVAATSGIHDAVETEASSFSGAQRHVECADCHNLHAATAANPLSGATGINPTNGTAGSAPGSYTFVTVTDADLQYQVCFKCHTNWAGTGTGTNAAVAFNPANDSFHWVEKDKYTYAVNTGSGKGIWQNATFNRTTVPNKSYTYVGAMMPRYSAYTDAQLRTAPMRCSDCHGSDAADGGAAIPEGPHGSTRARILKTPAGSNYTVWNSTVNYQSNAATIWCFNCHSSNFTGTGYQGGGNNLHTSSGHPSRACQDCHLAVPHGQTASGTANQRQHLLSPATFSDTIDTQNSGNYNENDGHNATLTTGCT